MMRSTKKRGALRIALAGLALLAPAGCDSPTGSRAPVPARLDIVAGDLQTQTVAKELPQPLVVKVTDGKGHVVKGQIVNFVVTAGEGRVFAGAALTDNNGEARERWTLGPVAGDTQRVEARAIDSATGAPLVFASFRAVGTPDVPSTVSPVGPASFTGFPGLALADSVAAVVRDAHLNPVPGATVVWTVAKGGGTASPATAVTGADGVARTRWTLGPQFDSLQVIEAAASLTLKTQFTANGRLPAGAALLKVSGDAQTDSVGQALPQAVVVRVQRPDGTPVAGVPVTFGASDGGSASPATATTGADGTASTAWTLGTHPGAQSLSATIPSSVAPVAFAATAVVGAPASITLTPGPLALVVGEERTLAAEVRDAYGNPLSGAAVAWSSSAPAVASASGTVLRALAPGSARITASLAGVLPANLDVTVASPGIASLSEGMNYQGICALDAAGNAYCWGATSSLGASDRPRRVPGGLHFTRVSAGDVASCGVVAAGQVWCWGRWRDPATGNEVQTATPVQASGGPVYSDVAMRTCAVAGAGIWCWESAGFGGALLTGGAFTTITSGGNSFCALAANGVPWCWGDNAERQLGRVTTVPPCLLGNFCAAPAPIASGQSFERIRVGKENTCAQAADGSSYCWGRGDFNLLQQAVPKACNFRVTQQTYLDACTATPVQIQTTPALASLTPGADAICGLAAGGQAYCWGLGTSGQLGNGSTADSPLPVAVAGGHAFVSLAAGNAFFCGLDTGGQVWCWGRNDHGQMGNGSLTDSAVPVAIF